MFFLCKSVLSDCLSFLTRLVSYCYWNSKGVRITLSCSVSMRAKIQKGCVFTGTTSISDQAVNGKYTYGHNLNIHHAVLGDYCSLAPNVCIGLDEHPLDQKSTHPHFYTPLVQKNAIIGHHVWIGAQAVVAAGKIVGDHAVVAAGAVVVKDVPAHFLVGGVPAKTIRNLRQ